MIDPRIELAKAREYLIWAVESIDYTLCDEDNGITNEAINDALRKIHKAKEILIAQKVPEP